MGFNKKLGTLVGVNALSGIVSTAYCVVVRAVFPDVLEKLRPGVGLQSLEPWR
jgi:hypothetical protein